MVIQYKKGAMIIMAHGLFETYMVSNTGNEIIQHSPQEWSAWANWTQICAVLNSFSKLENAHGHARPWNDDPYLCVATDSLGRREMHLRRPYELPYLPCELDPKDSENGWYLFKESDVSYVLFESAGSKSRIEAQYLRNDTEGPSWEIKLWVPIGYKEDGIYKGAYYQSFFRGLGCIPPFLPWSEYDWRERLELEGRKEELNKINEDHK